MADLRLIAIAVWLMGCASSTAGGPSSARVPFARSIRGAAAAARLETVGGGTWIEVRASGDRDDAVRACEVIVERERSRRERMGDPANLARACDSEPLPPIAVAAGSQVLVDGEVLGPADLVLELGGFEGQATVTTLHAFPDAQACEALRDRLRRARARERSEAAARAQAFLASQRALAEDRVTRACAEHDELVQRCAALEEEAPGHARCAARRERTERRCRAARASEGAIRGPRERPSSEPVCVPAGRG